MYLLRILFAVITAILGLSVAGVVIWTVVDAGNPFQIPNVLTPWLRATLIDFYANAFFLCTWILCRENSWIWRIVWWLLFLCLGSPMTALYFIIQIFSIEKDDPFYFIFVSKETRELLREERRL